ncbi:MAG: Integral membrane protein [uncultured Solirubrobacteraceae bacterium]|uniref:Integral membrane protein n=1 Tax=uncultured Solirubrobacteraceae bacterium TaxID=1162706 RepID=A0A6J4RSY5_9ACTN|nr:MAG: Integral membrane protein [uncultured Solirubrobacteraceae bacterium]
MSTDNLAARAGRWSARHRRTAILGWLAFVIAAAVGGGSLGLNTFAWQENGPGESGRADAAVYEAFPQSAGEMVLIQSETGSATDPGFRAAVADVQRRLEAVPHVSGVSGPYDEGRQGLISRDGRSALVNFEIAGDFQLAQERVDPALAAVAAAAAAHPELRIEQFGDASVSKALGEVFERDFRRAETLSLPITLIILVIAFGSLVAAGLPVLLALSAVAGTIGLISIVSQALPVDESISSLVLLIGLAVGVDYSLFYLRREREERAAGRDAEAALEAAAATSGRAVLISGFTVMVAMAGMYFTGSATFSSFATGTILVVAVAMIGSITVLPALLSKLGDRVERGRIPFLGRRRERPGGSRLWGAALDRVLGHPKLAVALATALLLGLSIPALSLKTGVPGTDSLPRDLAVMQTFDRIEAAFPGGPLPAVVAVEADDVTSPAVTAAIAEMEERALATGRMREPVQVSVSPDKSVAQVLVPLTGDGADEQSKQALATLREQILPATIGRVDGVEVNVSGMTAQNEDFNALMAARGPVVFAFVLTMAFLLLLITFRSIVIPIKAILLNLLSVGAAYGVLVLGFQQGHLEGLLGFESTGTITSWLPLFLFVILFGLSMDYHVFILSRIREAHDRGMSTDEAVASGIRSTAGVVTSAAVVMVAVFAIFATLTALEFKQMGVGLAVAILIDATIVRGILLPASMKLLGDWNWYFPKRLRWLPTASPEPELGATRA